MSARHLRNLPVRLDPNDHGYRDGRSVEPGEVVVERDPDFVPDNNEHHDQRPARKARR